MRKLLLIISLFLASIIVLDVKAEELNEVESTPNNSPSVKYKTHVQSYGWQDYVRDGEMAGTTGEAKRIEALGIELENTPESNITYITYVQRQGWDNTWKNDGEISGTTGKARRVEAIKIKLIGSISDTYDIYYRVHIQSYGWLGWAKNGETAGSVDIAKRIEGIEIKLVPKGTGEATGDSYRGVEQEIEYTTHVQSYGWKNHVKNGELTGTTGEAKRIEAIKIWTSNSKYIGTVKYKSYIQGLGWEEDMKMSGQESGTTGQSKRIEAIKIELTNELSEIYDVYYRSHVQAYGWLGWAKNGEISGNIGYDLRLEGIEIKLVPKGTGEETGNSYIEKNDTISYHMHVRKIGNQEEKQEGEIAGTEGMALRAESITINKHSDLTGNILYQSYVEGNGWETEWTTTGNTSGTEGQSKAMQLIRIKLDGELGEKYDIYYRVHTEKYGWLGWAKNGEEAGADLYDIQAIQIKMILKINSNRSEYNTYNHHVVTGFYEYNGNIYYKDKYGKQVTGWLEVMGRKYFFNSLGELVAENARKVVDVSKWNGSIDWGLAKSTGGVDAVIIRGAYRGYGTGNLVNDEFFAENVLGASAQGLPIGMYIFSQAITEAEAIEEAERAISLADSNGGRLVFNMPIIFDSEFGNKSHTGRADNLSVEARTNIARAFLERVAASGYEPMLYASTHFLNNNLDMSKLSNYKVWVAQYNNYCTYDGPGQKTMWQYTSKGQISGFTGNVDISVWF